MSGAVLFAAAAAASEASPERPFIVVPEGPTVTHGDMLRRTERLARALRSAGGGAGGRVVVMLRKSPAAVLLYLACLRAGVTYVPVNPDFRAEEVRHILDDAEPALVVCDAGREEWLRALPQGRGGVPVVSLEDLFSHAAGAAGGAGDAVPGGDAPAVILYTSGTTGRPKGAMLGGVALLANGRALSAAWRFGLEDVLLHAVPLFHSHGLFVSLSCTLLSGSTVLLLPRFDAAALPALLPRASVFMAVPTMVTRLLAEPGLGREACRTLRFVACGSAPLAPADFTRFAERTGHEIVERYGMSETGINTTNPLDGPRVPGSVGLPLPGVEVRIGSGAGADGVGPVQLRGPHLFSGYWRRPDQTAEAMDAEWFNTGDLGRLDDRGYLHLVGRSKDLVITGGFNVYPAEVEAALHALPGVAEAAVFGVPHCDFGEAVTAALVPAPGASLDEGRIIAALRERMVSYKVPKRVILVPALPRNAIGKVVKTDLRRDYADLFA